ncbi:MAG: murein L,D-transpeptidase family protein [Pseudomonadota bacterium]
MIRLLRFVGDRIQLVHGTRCLTTLCRILALGAAAVLVGCAGAPELHPAKQPLPQSTMMLLGKKGMDQGAPIFIRIFKEESELEVWKQRSDGRFYHFKTYPICNWSGALGPKLRQGDKQAPEGFYSVPKRQMNPNSKFHLAFNIGYPNKFDRAHNRTGNFLMVHGRCSSVGCYAMTDAIMEEIYGLAREAFAGGQERFHVHAFPFRMTGANMRRHRKHHWYNFWRTLKVGYDHFELHRMPPQVAVCERDYKVNVHLPPGARLRANAACPHLQRPMIEPFVPQPSQEQLANQRIVVPGVRKRTIANIANTRQIGLDTTTRYSLGAYPRSGDAKDAADASKRSTSFSGLLDW